ncbi:MAG TPA: hypothetical protein VIH89_07450 [Candidatus Sulfotelmatobacter sp.]|jgi:hypothetical protein
MFSQIFVWLMIAWGALACIYMLRCAWTRFPRRNLNDVVHFLHPVDLSLVDSLLDPAADFALRWNSTPHAYREAQRHRMRLYLELVRRMSHNSRVLIEFGNAIMRRECPDENQPHGQPGNQRAALASELQQAAISIRLYSLLVLVKLRLRLWFPLDALGVIPAPELAQLRKAGDVDGPKTYDDLKAAAAAAFVQFQPADVQTLTRNL